MNLHIRGTATRIRPGAPVYGLPAGIGRGHIVRSRLSRGAVSTMDLQLRQPFDSAPQVELRPWVCTVVVVLEGTSELHTDQDRLSLGPGVAGVLHRPVQFRTSPGRQRLRQVVYHLHEDLGLPSLEPLTDDACTLAARLVRTGEGDDLGREVDALRLLGALRASDSSPLDVAARARALLVSELEAPPSVSRLARAVGVTPRTLNRKLRQRFGVTVLELLQRERIGRARQFLRGSEVPVGRLGLELGFSSPSHFTRVFREHTGVTPSVFRRDARAQRSASASEPQPDPAAISGPG